MKIEIGAPVRTRDGKHVGEVHRVLIDLDDHLVTGIVVLKGRLLSRDILVPIDFIDRVEGDEVVLTLDEAELDQLPDFAYNEILAPPPAWTLFAHDMRIPAEWVERADESAAYVAATKVDIETGLGPQSRALSTARAGS